MMTNYSFRYLSCTFGVEHERAVLEEFLYTSFLPILRRSERTLLSFIHKPSMSLYRGLYEQGLWTSTLVLL